MAGTVFTLGKDPVTNWRGDQCPGSKFEESACPLGPPPAREGTSLESQRDVFAGDGVRIGPPPAKVSATLQFRKMHMRPLLLHCIAGLSVSPQSS